MVSKKVGTSAISVIFLQNIFKQLNIITFESY